MAATLGPTLTCARVTALQFKGVCTEKLRHAATLAAKHMAMTERWGMTGANLVVQKRNDPCTRGQTWEAWVGAAC